MVSETLDLTLSYWALKNKFKLEVGLKNEIDSNYPEIVWFKMGIYVLTSFNVSYSVNNCSISIQGKDKMCLLNGEIGGALESPVDFGAIDEKQPNGDIIKIKLKIKDIIRNAVHVYGNEPYHNIIINDLDTYGLELLEYRYEVPLYLWTDEINSGNYVFKNALIESETLRYRIEGDSTEQLYSLKTLPNEVFVSLVNPLTGTNSGKVIIDESGNKIKIAKIEYGDTAGYRTTDLVYAGDLISNMGETITSVLDKIKNMLVEFEYFYNIDGQFVFQKKPSYITTMWGPDTNETRLKATGESQYSYIFKGNELLVSFGNNPQIGNIKNDYSIWGQRETVSGEAVPVHMRYAIDTKPVEYVSFEKVIYSTEEYDWRELIYRMALDYFKHEQEDDFELQLAKNNPVQYPSGRTGYENYYTDLQGFWRQLYDPNATEEEGFFSAKSEHKYWNKAVYTSPETLNFWFDFLDTNGLLGQYSIRKIGHRAKVINDTAIKSIYFRETPSVIFVKNINQEEQIPSYRYIQIGPENEEMFSISAQGKSAKNELDFLLNQHSYCADAVNISAIPIYYLEPNTRIYLYDENTKINGEYSVDKISFSLSHDGKMSISASTVAENII